MQEHSLSVYRTARYFVLGDPSGPVEAVWMACHGYGQHPAYFLRHFRAVEAPHRLIVAPEGLSRFYRDDAEGRHQRVGASWMTREARLAEIDDYVRLLDAVYAEVLERAGLVRARLTALGFSQGGATAARWLTASPMLRGLHDARLVLWGSVLPHDLDLAAHRAAMDRVRLTLVAGREDPHATPERVATEEARLHEHGIPYDLVRFEGEHRLDTDVLRALAEADRPQR